jgi:hypothetical protein
MQANKWIKSNALPMAAGALVVLILYKGKTEVQEIKDLRAHNKYLMNKSGKVNNYIEMLEQYIVDAAQTYNQPEIFHHFADGIREEYAIYM